MVNTQLELLGVRALTGGAIGWAHKFYAGRIEGGGLLKIKEGRRAGRPAMGGIVLFDNKTEIVKAVSSMNDPGSPYEWR